MSGAGIFYDLGSSVTGLFTSAAASATKKIEDLRKENAVVDWDRERKYGGPGKAEMIVSDNFVVIAADETTALGIGDGTVVMAGKVHMTRSPSEIRVNGFWVFNEELLTTVPSTLFNPVQTLLYKPPPYAKKVSKFAKLMKSFAF